MQADFNVATTTVTQDGNGLRRAPAGSKGRRRAAGGERAGGWRSIETTPTSRSTYDHDGDARRERSRDFELGLKRFLIHGL